MIFKRLPAKLVLKIVTIPLTKQYLLNKLTLVLNENTER